jgi:hypothetical protein
LDEKQPGLRRAGDVTREDLVTVEVDLGNGEPPAIFDFVCKIFKKVSSVERRSQLRRRRARRRKFPLVAGETLEDLDVVARQAMIRSVCSKAFFVRRVRDDVRPLVRPTD